MVKTHLPVERFLARTSNDLGLRGRLIENPRQTIEQELKISLSGEHEIHVHEDTYESTHIVLPPVDKFTESEREEARQGAASLAFLQKTMNDPAPPHRSIPIGSRLASRQSTSREMLAGAARQCIRDGLDFLASQVDTNGALHCIRFNLADSSIPRHFEKPPFISAYCALALESSNEAKARGICSATREYVVKNIEYPGVWRYYRHLPPDLDSTSTCSLLLENHPWILLGRNLRSILSNRDAEGRFMTWLLSPDEPEVASSFRIEADPVVNANLIAFLGDCEETKGAQRWLESLISAGKLEGASKWYPHIVTSCYAMSRASIRTGLAFQSVRPSLVDLILGLSDGTGELSDVLQTAQAVSTLYNLDSLDKIDAVHLTELFLDSQGKDGCWPEILAFGDQSLNWGSIGQIGHGSESVTTAFCIEALEHLVEHMTTIDQQEADRRCPDNFIT